MISPSAITMTSFMEVNSESHPADRRLPDPRLRSSRFSPQQQVSQEEIDQAKERLRKLQLFQKHGAKFDESQLDFQAKTREELVRKAAEIIRSAVVNPFGIHEHSAQ